MLSLLFFLISSIGCVISANLIKSQPGKIVDIIHTNIGRLRAPYLSDSLVLFQTIGTAALVDLEILSEILFIMSITQFFRIICSLSTALPPLKNYHDKYRLGGLNGTGTEYIFSGHASYSAISAIYLYTHNIVPLWVICVYNFVSQFLIVVTHNHYTVDIILAWIVVPLIYGNIRFCQHHDQCREFMRPLL